MVRGSPLAVGLRTAGILWGEIGVVACYLPDGSYTLGDFVDALKDIITIHQTLYKQGAKTIYTGGDFNISLPLGIPGVTGDASYGHWEHDHKHWERQQAIIQYSHLLRSHLGSTFEVARSVTEHCTFTQLGQARGAQLDYFWTPYGSEQRIMRASDRILRLGNKQRDHLPLCIQILGGLVTPVTLLVRSWAGWTPSSEPARWQNRAEAEAHINLLSKSILPEEADKAIDKVAAVTRFHADQVRRTTKSSRRRDVGEKPERARKLEEENLRTPPGPARKEVRKRVRRAQRAWHRTKLRAEIPVTREKDPKKLASAVKTTAEGEPIHERDEWTRLSNNYYTNKYRDPAEGLEEQTARLAFYEAKSRLQFGADPSAHRDEVASETRSPQRCSSNSPSSPCTTSRICSRSDSDMEAVQSACGRPL